MWETWFLWFTPFQKWTNVNARKTVGIIFDFCHCLNMPKPNDARLNLPFEEALRRLANSARPDGEKGGKRAKKSPKKLGGKK